MVWPVQAERAPRQVPAGLPAPGALYQRTAAMVAVASAPAAVAVAAVAVTKAALAARALVEAYCCNPQPDQYQSVWQPQLIYVAVA